MDDMLKLFECPVCFGYVMPAPIAQCKNTHLVCSKCRPKLTCCPTCQAPMADTRNYTLEQIGALLLFPCQNASEGCPAKLLWVDKEAHEDLCPFEHYPCPMSQPCSWRGGLDQFKAHLKTHLTSPPKQGQTHMMQVKLGDRDTTWWTLQEHFGQTFFWRLWMKKPTVHFAVWVLGNQAWATVFRYSIALTGRDGAVRQIWEANVRSMRDTVDQVVASDECLMLDERQTRLFTSSAGFLTIHVTISQAE